MIPSLVNQCDTEYVALYNSKENITPNFCQRLKESLCVLQLLNKLSANYQSTSADHIVPFEEMCSGMVFVNEQLVSLYYGYLIK